MRFRPSLFLALAASFLFSTLGAADLTITFATKVTETGYQRVRNAVLAAYQAAVNLREKGHWGDEGQEGPAGASPVA